MNRDGMIADALRRAYCEARGVTELLEWDVLKLSEQEQWLGTGHIFQRIVAATQMEILDVPFECPECRAWGVGMPPGAYC